MKKWLISHWKVVVLVLLTAGWAVGIVLTISWGHRLDEVLLNSVIWAIYVGALGYYRARRERITAARLASLGAIKVHLRYPDSRPGSLSGIWNLGVATFDGRSGMTFQPSVYDTLEPSGRPLRFSILAAQSTEPRKLERKEQKYLTQPGLHALRLTTDKGNVEVAGRPESLRKILNIVGPQKPTS